MTKTIEELKQRAQEVAELDKKRTQGEWYFDSVEDIHDDFYGELKIQSNQVFILADTEHGTVGIAGETVDRHIKQTENDYNLMSKAPAMAQLIADQQAKIEELEMEMKDWFREAQKAMRHVSDKESDHLFEMMRYINRIEELEKQTQWQPIETAPNDGTEILLLRPLNWGEESREKEELRVGSGNFIFAGWWVEEYGRWRERLGGYIGSPTHWMPLPTPPEEKAND